MKFFFFRAPLDFDAVIVGGGIVGCATARQLLIQKPNLKIAIIEKEDKLGNHLNLIAIITLIKPPIKVETTAEWFMPGSTIRLEL